MPSLSETWSQVKMERPLPSTSVCRQSNASGSPSAPMTRVCQDDLTCLSENVVNVILCGSRLRMIEGRSLGQTQLNFLIDTGAASIMRRLYSDGMYARH